MSLSHRRSFANGTNRIAPPCCAHRAEAATGDNGASTNTGTRALRRQRRGKCEPWQHPRARERDSHHRRSRTNAPVRGTVTVSFAIASSGRLADVRVGRSSGVAALDRLALDHIRRAAPFPPPPAGAQTSFRFEFVGRP